MKKRKQIRNKQLRSAWDELELKHLESQTRKINAFIIRSLVDFENGAYLMRNTIPKNIVEVIEE